MAAVALVAILLGGWHLHQTTADLIVDRTMVGDLPVTVFARPDDAPSPVIVIAHGFAGSQQLMLPFAVTLARNGYRVLTFDFPGHGRNGMPLPGGITDQDASGVALAAALDQVVGFARTLPGGDGGIALLGHSMASEVVVKYAEQHPKIAATVAVSLFSPGVTPDSPRNLLVIDGALEPAMLTDQAYTVVAMAAGGPAHERVTYGLFGNGTARRLSLSHGVEHIGVLYSGESMQEALAWMDQVFDRHGPGTIDRRGPWLGLLFFGLVALAWPLSMLLPKATPKAMGGGFAWRPSLWLGFVPAIATPLILWKIPTGFLPLLLGDYLVVHFAVYGVLTAAGIRILGGRADSYRSPQPVFWPKLLLAALAMTAYSLVAVGLPIDRFVTAFVAMPARLPLVLAMLCGTLPYFLADEWATRGEASRRGAYALSKVAFLISLMIAVALNPQRLFFLVIIIPVMLIFFTMFGLFSGWAYRRTGHPFVGALANALTFAWAIAVTFPVVGP